MKKFPRGENGFDPYEILKGSVHTTTAFILFRPVLIILGMSLFVLVYAAINNRKVQNTLLSLPYGRFYRTIKSEKMITFYATVVEVVFEVLTAVILAGVSILITSWLLLEEAADRRDQKTSTDAKTRSGHSQDFTKKESTHSVSEKEGKGIPVPRFSQHSYYVPASHSRISRR